MQFNAKDYKGAVNKYKELVSTYADRTTEGIIASAKLRIGELYLEFPVQEVIPIERTAAVPWFQQVVKEYPDTRFAAQALFSLAFLYHKIGIRAKAREYAQQLVQPQYKRYQLQYVHGLYSLAFYDQMDGKEESAIEQYENLIQSYPKSKMAPEALREIARMHYFKGDLDGAIEVTQRIIDNYPNSDTKPTKRIDGY